MKTDDEKKPGLLQLSKHLWAGVFLILLGISSYIAEQIFYGGVDENGVLQESFFLPLAFILGLIGLIMLFIGLVKTRR